MAEERLVRIQDKIKRKEGQLNQELDMQRTTITDLENKLMDVDRKENKRISVISCELEET
jgi:hypothetical protein